MTLPCWLCAPDEPCHVHGAEPDAADLVMVVPVVAGLRPWWPPTLGLFPMRIEPTNATKPATREGSGPNVITG